MARSSGGSGDLGSREYDCIFRDRWQRERRVQRLRLFVVGRSQWEPQSRGWVPDGSFSAWGAGGHFIAVIPALQLVVVHRVDTEDPENKVTLEQFGKLLRLILVARKSSPRSPVRLICHSARSHG